MPSDDDDLMREFLVESRENLNQLDRDLVELEQNPRDPKLLGAIFRCVHTIKGTAGFLARNQIMQYGVTSKDAGFVNASQRLNLLTTELQAGVMKTRMQPIGNVWNRFPRIVRDLANVCGKKVSLELDGTETELDRSIIEAIKDPLTHAVRNAVDHGIESQERRRSSGKPAIGRVVLQRR